MEYWNMTTCSVHFWAGVNNSAVPTSWVVNYFHSFFLLLCTIRFRQGLYWTYRVYRRKYIERHNFATLLWTWFLLKMLSEVSIERVRILIIRDFLRFILERLFHYLFKNVLDIFNVKVTAEFTRDFVNNRRCTTYSFLYTPTVYFLCCVTVAFSIEKMLRC